MKILILGDVGATESNCQAFCGEDKDLFSCEIQKLCAEADIILLNLEKPLTNVITPLGKCPPDYVAPTETINGIKLLNPTVAILANNHIMDQKEQGLHSTMDVLAKHGILYVGAGNNIREARKPVVITCNELKIGIYACCEKEFSFATESSAGANVFDPIETFDDIPRLKTKCDYLIVLYHGGMQGYPYPTPYQQKVCRKMCEKGADLVVCQHSHIIGCEECYVGGRIVYGQGNLLLDDVVDEYWHSGMIVEFVIDEKSKSIDYIPVQTRDHKVILHPNSSKIKDDFIKRGQIITDEETVKKLFSEYSENKLSEYLVKLSGKSVFLQKVYRRLGITKHYKRFYSENALNMMLDYFYCDSHREAIEYGLEKFVQEKKRK